MMRVVFRAETQSPEGHVIRVDILANRDTPLQEVYLGAGDAVTVEWDEVDEASLTQGSRAQIILESEYSGQLSTLYAAEVGDVVCNIYIDGERYWCGVLDPEFYEEPWERENYFDVTLTFTDFGALAKKKITTDKHALSIAEILRAGCKAVNLGWGDALEMPEITEYLTTRDTLADGTTWNILSTEDVYVDSSVFTKNDKTWREALTHILAPLGWRITQKGGKFVVYETDAVGATLPIREVQWTSDTQTYAAVPAISKVTMTHNAGEEDNLMPEITLPTQMGNRHLDPLPIASSVISARDGQTTPTQAHWWTPEDSQWDKALKPDGAECLSLYTSGDAEGLATIADDASGTWPPLAFKMTGAHTKEGVVGFYRAPGGQMIGERVSKYFEAHDPYTRSAEGSLKNRALMTVEGGWIPAPDTYMYDHANLRVKMDALFDFRWAPFDNADKEVGDANNNAEIVALINKQNPTIYVPVLIGLYDTDGTLTHYWRNDEIARNRPDCEMPDRKSNLNLMHAGEWVPATGGKAPTHSCWLCYRYDEGKVGGWVTNRHVDQIFRDKDINESDVYKKYTQGEILEYPPAAGQLRITVFEGLMCFCRNLDHAEWERLFTKYERCTQVYKVVNGVGGYYCSITGELLTYGHNSLHAVELPRAVQLEAWAHESRHLLGHLNWALYSAPVTEVLDGFDLWEHEDTCLSGYVNRRASTEIDITSDCGSMLAHPHPFARGVLMRADGSPLARVSRAGVSGNPERLRIGGLFSQSDTPRRSYTGEASLPTSLTAYKEHNTPNAVFIATSETAYPIRDVSTIKLTEVRRDKAFPELIDEA